MTRSTAAVLGAGLTGVVEFLSALPVFHLFVLQTGKNLRMMSGALVMRAANIYLIFVHQDKHFTCIITPSNAHLVLGKRYFYYLHVTDEEIEA